MGQKDFGRTFAICACVGGGARLISGGALENAT